MDPIKVEGVGKWPVSTCVKDVRSFLGFCNFYRAFIPSFSHITWPLNDLTKKGQQWTWTGKEQCAFNMLKDLCVTYPVLRTPKWSWQFILETNASGYALGAVLMQEFNDKVHPIAFNSQSLLPAEQNYDAHNKELVGVVYGFKCGRPFLLGTQHTVYVRTDHKNLQYFQQPQKITGQQAWWFEFLQDFDYTLKHIPGFSNTIADLLSHRKDLNEGVNVNEPRILLPNHLFIKKTYLKDDISLQRQAMRELHDTPSAGHPGITNTWELIQDYYEEPRLWKFVEEYVKGCPTCQETKANVHQTKAPLQRFNTDVEDGPFQHVSMDLITDLPKSDGFDSILTIVNQGCSKAAKFIPCHKTINEPDVANEYLKHLVPWFGIPKRIISDWDPCFASHFSKTLCTSLGVQQNLFMAFHPRTDGQTERMNAWVEQYLRAWVTGRQGNWAKMLPMVEYAHNSWKHNVMQKSPPQVADRMQATSTHQVSPTRRTGCHGSY